MSDNVSGPTLRELFGDLDFREADLGRSVYSPAAYLADLLQMLEDELPVKDFKRFASRRPDIAGEQGIILDGEQSFTNIPHLEIVNRVMAAQVKHNSGGMAAEAVLASAQHPLASFRAITAALAVVASVPSRSVFAFCEARGC